MKRFPRYYKEDNVDSFLTTSEQICVELGVKPEERIGYFTSQVERETLNYHPMIVKQQGDLRLTATILTVAIIRAGIQGAVTLRWITMKVKIMQGMLPFKGDTQREGQV